MNRLRTKVSRKTSSSSAQIFASIDDLLIQVFVRIPLKQVFRLKLVSKHWDSIISDPKLHLSLRNPEPAVGLIFRCRIKNPLHSFIAHKSYILCFNQPTITKLIDDGVQVLHSCNGLLLCKSGVGYQHHFIYNPITKKSSSLFQRIGTSFIVGMYLAFDPSESCHYKFVYVVELKETRYRPQSHKRFKFEVYSSKTGSWRRCGEPFSGTVVDFEDGVYWRGAIHWVSLKKSGKSIYFDPAGCDNNKKMLPKVMPTPPVLEDAVRPSHLKKGRNYHFGESYGHLNFIDTRPREFEFNVYEMKNDYSEWFVKYRVDISNFVVSDMFCICTLVRGMKDEDSFLVLRVGEKFIRCNLDDKTCETIYECKGGIDTQFEKELLGHDGEFPLQYI